MELCLLVCCTFFLRVASGSESYACQQKKGSNLEVGEPELGEPSLSCYALQIGGTVHLAKMCQGAWLTSLPTQGRGRQLLADKRRCRAQILSSLPRACALVVGELVRVSVLVAVGLVAWLVRSPNRA